MSDEENAPAESTPPPSPESTPPAAPPAAPAPASGNGADKKLVAGLLGILIGSLGIHKFYLGYQKEGLIMCLVTVLTCGFGAMVFGIIGLIEGILYLTKSDEEFVATYITGNKPWF